MHILRYVTGLGGWGMLTFMWTCVTCTSYVTSLGWGGWGMLTFMLTCVTCTSYVTSLGWGVGDVNVHVNLRHMHILCYVTGLVLDELQDEKSFGGHRSSLERPCSNVSWKKRPGEVFRNKFPVIYRLSFKTHFKIPGNFEPILGHESVVSLWRKNDILKKEDQRRERVRGKKMQVRRSMFFQWLQRVEK